MTSSLDDNLLLRGDMLAAAGALAPGSIDLLYLDPPFAAGRVFSAAAGSFDDRWPGGLRDYLGWLGARLAALRPALAAEGSLFLHLDRRAVHYAKVMLDEQWGVDCFRNEIIWHYTGGGRARRVFAHKHDTILWYSNHPRRWTFNRDAVREPYAPGSGYARGGIRSAAGKVYLPHPDGTPPDDVWAIPMINPLAPERVGYPTQKPERLLARIILAASAPGGAVADLCCGSGTTLVAAARLGRRWIGGDSSAAAIAAAEARLAALEPPPRWETVTLG
ncbi:MAG TPA: site-specific DNA-methyltransferase [Herpetosiphonaceae bacterium]